MSHSTSPKEKNRFAPTPSGPLHMGSLYLAIIDFIRAKQFSRSWLLRIDDLDLPRVAPGAIDQILRVLEQHQLLWDELHYQSESQQYYDEALSTLIERDLVFACSCSRQALAARGLQTSHGFCYPGFCRDNVVRSFDHARSLSSALRIQIDNVCVRWRDERLGEQAESLTDTVGDFVLRRKDGVYAYHLASAIDDARLGVTHVNRGEDLVSSLARQYHLLDRLGASRFAVSHYPLIVDAEGQKLAKQHKSPAVEGHKALVNWQTVLGWLGFAQNDIRQCQQISDCIALGLQWDGTITEAKIISA